MRKIDELLQQFLDRIGQSDGAPYIGLFRSWRSIVGDRLADHAEPVDIRGTALVIEADHPGWVQMVMFQRSRILSQVNRRFPELTITSLHIRVAGDRAARAEAAGTARRSDTPAQHEGSAEPPAEPSETDREALGKIEDTDLRDSLARLRKTLKSDETPGDKP